MAQHCLWNLSPEWALSNVPIIRLNSFKIIKTSQQVGMENFDITVLAAREWTIDPLHFSSENPNSNLIPETRLQSEFVAKLLLFCGTFLIIDVDPPVIKIDLTKRIC
jgi:hypothetical protein